MYNPVFPLKRWGLGPILAYILISSLSPRLQAQIVSLEVRKVSERFVCQCGCNHQLSVCSMLNCGSATPLRAEIDSYLKEGKTEEQIVSLFVAKYGKRILSAPTTKGLDLTAWIVPFFMLLVGLLFVIAIVLIWLHRRGSAASQSTLPSAISDDMRKRIEAELKEM
jgi:cytochrome c-type biogenesis protein CcmH/NrfF